MKHSHQYSLEHQQYATPFYAPPRGHRNKKIPLIQDHFYTIPTKIRGPLPKILSDLEERSEVVLCPNCGRFVVTRTKIRRGCVISSNVVVCLCLLFCLLGLWVCLPFLFWCYNRKRKFCVQHFCSKCNDMIFEFKV